jgi:hypothetical protein
MTSITTFFMFGVPPKRGQFGAQIGSNLTSAQRPLMLF